MTELTLKVTDESLFRSIEGVEIAPRRNRKSGIELPHPA